MGWGTSNWLGTGGSGGEMTIHGSDMHDSTVPKIINPNLLYNSTGMMNLGGWIVHPKVINYRDEFIIDDFSYFLVTGDTEDTPMVSASLPLEAGVEYTFSGEFVSDFPIRVKMLYQDQAGVNDLDQILSTVELFTEVFPSGSERRVASFTVPEGVYCGCLSIEHLADNETVTAIYKRMKIEKGSVATEWIPCLTDPYQNTIYAEGMNAYELGGGT